MGDYSAKPGDCFNSIAFDNHFFNYQTVYKHGRNSTIKNPNMLVEGAVVEIPDKKQKEAALNLDGEKKFVVDRKPVKVRLLITDMDKKALTVTSSNLEVGSAKSAGPPDAKGLLELNVPPGQKDGKLVLAASMPINAPASPPPVPPGPAPAVPPHPPSIDPAAFTDVQEKPSDADIELTWNLNIGFLEPVDVIRGCLQRLHDLGCKTPDPLATVAENDDTARVVKSYQKFLSKTCTGKLEDLQSDLETAHDKV